MARAFESHDLIVFVPVGHPFTSSIATGILTQRVYSKQPKPFAKEWDRGVLNVHIFGYKDASRIIGTNGGLREFPNVLLITNQDNLKGGDIATEVEYNDMLNDKFPSGKYTVLSICPLHTVPTEQKANAQRVRIIRRGIHAESSVINDNAQHWFDNPPGDSDFWMVGAAVAGHICTTHIAFTAAQPTK